MTIIALLVARLAQAASGCAGPPALEITHVNVIDVTTGTITRGATIMVEDGRICRIAVTTDSTRSKTVRRIDGRGRYAIPGLWWSAASAADADRLVGYGVTYTTRVTGHNLDLHENLARQARLARHPLDVLRSLTMEAAASARRPNAGILAAGYEASLLLLEANPLDDVRNVRSISLVLLRGQPLGLVALARARTGHTEGTGGTEDKQQQQTTNNNKQQTTNNKQQQQQQQRQQHPPGDETGRRHQNERME